MLMTLKNKYAFLRCILLVAVAMTLTLSVMADEDITTQSPAFDEYFYHFIRPRLGHFSRNDGWLKIYEEYKANVLASNDKELARLHVNDWRNVRPTGELCVDFLTGFQVKDYSLAKPFDLIMLDACLDWLFDTSNEKKLDMDRFNDITIADHDKLLKDSELKKIFNNTKFKDDTIPKELKDKLYEYFARLMKISAENPRSGCNGLYLAAYDDFIEEVYLGDCEDEIKCDYFSKFAKFDGIKKEPYLNLIIDSTKQVSKNCYGTVQKQMVEHMHQSFEDEPMQASIKRKFKKINSKAARQSTEKKWAREMMRILQITSNVGIDDTVDLGEVIKVLKGIKDDDEDIKDDFLASIGAYAIKEIDAKDTAGDANGRARFGKAMMDICGPYVDKKSFLVRTGGSHLWEDDPTSKSKPFEFFEMVYSLIRITNHMPLYKTSKDKFENDVLKNGWEALYLATLSCHLISTTWGELSYDTNKPEFQVMFRKTYHESIDDWPIEIMYTELTKNGPSRPSRPSKPESYSRSKSKFSLFSKSRSKNSSEDEPEPEPEPIPEPKVDSVAPDDESLNNKPKETISLDTIEMFKKLHGRYPQLSQEVKDKYAGSLPSDLSGTYTKTLGLKKPGASTTTTTTTTPAPQRKQSRQQIDLLSL